MTTPPLTHLENRLFDDCSFWYGPETQKRTVEAFIDDVTNLHIQNFDCTVTRFFNKNRAADAFAEKRKWISRELARRSVERYPIMPPVEWAKVRTWRFRGVRWERVLIDLREEFEFTLLCGGPPRGDAAPAEPLTLSGGLLMAMARQRRLHAERREALVAKRLMEASKGQKTSDPRWEDAAVVSDSERGYKANAGGSSLSTSKKSVVDEGKTREVSGAKKGGRVGKKSAKGKGKGVKVVDLSDSETDIVIAGPSEEGVDD
ncbi:hypothetical protein CC1G_05879 [Coprinopsis cinerea okayama7|uniref:Uncharacterized protein n=1 Tax=Coprinopsis cinerea (strain Okayama-7 / 130 / ATCC MYA-4618 / FGSC 9003) TaxID=240176 RepID=A8NAC8_COPC7|nr:hypothetical protein CC1G_05879 [Coprinopsis cinerea okayama7\|eukprot:XP_001831780.1 hypothetical protein CC1G_05879 [Coprinopsis cinerea okayama7\